ncbi:MAG TPA: hypothetical protein ENI23_11585 [bacterium]|nr:hypothetical protein [bacterium]
MVEEITIIATFGGGLATFLAPCTFATLPVFLTYIIGSTAEEIHDGGKKAKFKAIFNALFYILGFTVVFVLLGLTATSLGKFFLQEKSLLSKIGGGFVVLFGIIMVFGEKIPFLRFLYRERKIDAGGKLEGYNVIRAFLIGVTSAVEPII